MKLDLNKFATDVHALAVEKGFYDPQPSDADLIAAVHAEISEAFEEWRAGRPMVYHECVLDLMCDGNGCSDGFDPNDECKYRNPKPEGIAVELIDVALRVLDAAATWNVALDISNISVIGPVNLPEEVAYLHSRVAEVYEELCAYGTYDSGEVFSEIIADIFRWLRARGIDPEALMLEKHEYNRGRPYRHGGKRV